ncbi:MAG TPA: DUF47 family protein [bacterium]|nr:DUF47 family protein [bacterium]
MRPDDADSQHTAVDASQKPPVEEFQLLEEMANTIFDGARTLKAALDGSTPTDEAWETIRELEHKGDAVARDLFEGLTASRPLVVETDALKALTGYLDDVLDAIEAAAARLAIHKVRRAIPSVREMGEIVLESAQELTRVMGQLRRMQDVFPHTRALHRLENRGDDVLRDGIEALFSGRTSAKDIIKWKDILELLEGSTDRCEDIANVLESLLIRAGADDRLIAGRLMLDTGRHEVTVNGGPVPLSAKEFALLHLLLRHQGKVVRRERLLNEVWGADYYGDTRTLDTHIGWLRKKVEDKGGIRLVSVRGIGYRLDLTE